ncbi:PRC-barrel domain-containing protein [Microvirga subterranea]|uniref:Sporulation protein YlmC with PRC-barrel domain n=1 Tax=Microvirga subterranea TaxID=186651 RepID=A0A370HJ76_9HYPH|nr:PRC-barrel domain-containing protein [Microvirga subterranea]RDI58579.1 sporulation protein YlmC with PRC-barrel domain [Microvirga subterranea]
MLTRVAIGLLAGTLLSAPVLAQTSTSPSTSAPAGSSTAPATTTQGSQMNQGSSAMQGGNIQYITQGKPDMWRASKLDGVNVYNQNNERIGEIDDVLVDKSGKVEAVVIGVGGFLGIGERNVAVPFDSLQWQMEEPRTAANTTTGTTTSSGTTTTTAPATTGTVANAPANNTAGSTSANNMPEAPARAVLANATKDQLKQAPEFKYSR